MYDRRKHFRVRASITIVRGQDNMLPPLRESELRVMGLPSKPVLLKANIIERNLEHHPDVTLEQLGLLLEEALYNPDEMYQDQRKGYLHFIKHNVRMSPKHVGKMDNALATVDITVTKDSFEIVHSFWLNDKKRLKYKKNCDRGGTGDPLIAVDPLKNRPKAAAGPDSYPKIKQGVENFLQFAITDINININENKNQVIYASTSEEIRRKMESRMRGLFNDTPNARDSEFDPAVYELLRENPRLINHIDPEMDVSQVIVIQDGLDAGVDVSKFNDPSLTWLQMNAIFEYLKRDIDVTPYPIRNRNERIIREVGEAIKQGMSSDEINNMLGLHTWTQMQEVRLGLRDGVDIATYADPNIHFLDMRKARKGLTRDRL